MTQKKAAQRIAKVQKLNLTSLDLTGLKLTEIPREVFTLKQLKQLIIRQNRLSEIPKEIVYLPNLNYLDISHNQLSYLPFQMKDLALLKYFNLSHNYIKELPYEVQELVQLEHLDLSHNQLVTLPAEIEALINLVYLDLSHNALISLPSVVAQLPKLQQLFVYPNRIQNIPAEMLQHQSFFKKKQNALQKIKEYFRQNEDMLLFICEVCEGTGFIGEKTCYVCRGKGSFRSIELQYLVEELKKITQSQNRKALEQEELKKLKNELSQEVNQRSNAENPLHQEYMVTLQNYERAIGIIAEILMQEEELQNMVVSELKEGYFTDELMKRTHESHVDDIGIRREMANERILHKKQDIEKLNEKLKHIYSHIQSLGQAQ
ncbi:hypothetical protein BKI52_26560 [marine bacterium AO1-C]|nr:hypothetical protein BKI52_26560 [marine bacterium AO1-C]